MNLKLGDTYIIADQSVGAPGPAGTVNPQQFTVTYDPDDLEPVVVDFGLGDIAVLTLTSNVELTFVGTRKKCILVLCHRRVR
jgi:hypothetical protein